MTATVGLGSPAVPAGGQAQEGTTLIHETFTGAEAPDFTGYNEACLTGAPGLHADEEPPGDHALGGCEPPTAEVGPVPPLDAAPHGYLRLTDAGGNRTAAVLYNHPLPANAGLDVTFDVWQYGNLSGLPADGVSFFLTDGEASLTTPGQFGGSLGYAQKESHVDGSPTGIQPGVDDGYLGVGLDVLGNYFGDREQRGNGCEEPYHSPARALGSDVDQYERGPNMVIVRGPGNGDHGYCYITATSDYAHQPRPVSNEPWPSNLPGDLQGPWTGPLPSGVQAAETALEPSRRQVRVRLTPAPDPQLIVTVDFNDDTGPHQVLDVAAPTPVPPSYKFGFAASTGYFNDVHLIRNVAVATDRPLPELNLVKQVTEPRPGHLNVGDEVPYEFVLTNGGTIPITDLEVSDPVIGPVSCPTEPLESEASITCTATYTITEDDVARGYVANTAEATGQADGEPVTSEDSELLDLIGPPGLTVEKRVLTSGPYAPGQTVHWSYLVTNTGGVTLENIRVDDDHVTGITCADDTLAPGDHTTCEGTYLITEADASNGQVTNTAEATGTANGETVTSPQVEETLYIRSARVPGIIVMKEASPDRYSVVGEPVTYTYTVENTGTVPLTDVIVDDDVFGPISDCQFAELAAEEVRKCTFVYHVTRADLDRGRITDSATALGADPDGTEVAGGPSDEVTVTADHAPGIRVDKTAEPPSFSRVGQVIRYSYRVRNTGNVTLSHIIVRDSRLGVVGCPRDTLAAHRSMTCARTDTTTAEDVRNGQISNTAEVDAVTPFGEEETSPMVTLDVQEERPSVSIVKTASQPGFVRAGQAITYAYHVTNTGNVRLHDVTVSDSVIGAVSCRHRELRPRESMTCTARYKVTAADVERGYVSNTATVGGKTPSEAEIREQSTKTLRFAPVPPITKVPVRVTG